MARKQRPAQPKPELKSGHMKNLEFAQYVAFYGMEKNLKGFGALIGGIGARSVGKYMRGDQAIPAQVAENVRSLLYPRRDASTSAPAPAPVVPPVPDVPAGAAAPNVPSAQPVPKGTKATPKKKPKDTKSSGERKLRYTAEITFTVNVYEEN